MNLKLDKFGSIGALLAAAACPVCFPKLAMIGALVGFGAFSKYEIYFFIAAQILVLVALVGTILSYKKHKNSVILMLALASVALFFASLYLFVNEYLSYLALAGLVTSILWQIKEAKSCIKTSEAELVE